MKFRKLPVTVEAVPVHEVLNAAKLPQDAAAEALPEWLVAASVAGDVVVLGHAVTVATLEGTMYGMPGDWIIRGVAGEIYPCKPEIFAKTYVAVTDADEIVIETTATGARPEGLFDNSLGELARDCNRDVTIPRTLVRRTISDLDFLIGWFEGMTAGLAPKTPEQRAAIEHSVARLAGAAGRVRQLHTCAGIGEDEDLDD